MESVSLILSVLPLALGAAMSPTLLVLQLAILTGPYHPLQRAWALAIGRMLSLAVITFGGASLLARLPDFNTGFLTKSPYAGVIFLTAGVVLVALAGWHWHRGARRSGTDGDSDKKGMTSRLLRTPAPALFVFAAAWMFVNASTLALYIPALHNITRSSANIAGKGVALLLLYLLTSAVVLVPPLLVTVFGDSIRPRLKQLQEWLEKHSHTISLVVLGVFGVALIGLGIWNMVRR